MEKKKITRWNVYKEGLLKMVPSPKDRIWMKETPDSFAYRCLPLTVANGFGWSVLNLNKTKIIWDGSDKINGVKIYSFDENGNEIDSSFVSSHFGSGVVTFSFDFLMQTELGHNLYVKGPANNPKRAITALEGIVETDWLPFTFTMNWKMTEPMFEVVFEKDEPICQIFPIQRFYMESWEANEDIMENNTDLQAKFTDWKESRTDYLKNLSSSSRGQRDYIKGLDKDGNQFKDHQNTVKSCPFMKLFGKRSN